MQVELVSKNVYWCGSKGLRIEATVDLHDNQPMPEGYEADDIESTLAQVMGRSVQRFGVLLIGTGLEPEVSISRNDWGRPLSGKSHEDLTKSLEQWVGKGNPLGWKEEISNYQLALSRVDLPCSPEDVQAADKCLVYKVTILGKEDFKVAVPLEVRETEARLSVGLLKGQHDNFISIGDCYISGAVNLDTVRAAVLPVMTRFLQGVQHLMERVAQPVDNA